MATSLLEARLGEVARLDTVEFIRAPFPPGVHHRLMDTIGGGFAVARRTRRFWSKDEKRRIVAQNFAPGVSVSQVGRRYDVNANLIFK